MAKQLNIVGNSTIEEDIKYSSLLTLSKLDAQTLSNLEKLAKSAKAVDYVRNKFSILKAFIS